MSRLRVDRLWGAVTFPKTEGERSHLWHLSWQRLGTKEFCHVQDLLRPWSAPAIPALLAVRGETREHMRIGKAEMPDLLLPPRLHRSIYALAERSQKALTHMGQPNDEARDYRLKSIPLTPRHWEIVNLCFAHPLLSREDFSHLLLLNRTSVNLLLAGLKRAGYLESVETGLGDRWHLSETGLRLLARLVPCHVHRLVRLPREEQMPLMQRGLPGLLHQIRHTAGVYAFFALLTEALATRTNARVNWWETGVITERHFLYREKTYRFRPDAQASVQLDTRAFRFWLEWGRGTMTPKDLRIKFTTYAMYLHSREWASSSPYLPAILCVTPDIAQEHKLMTAAIQRLVLVPSALCVYTTTANLLLTQGILQPIWRQVVLQEKQQGRPALPETLHRVALFRENEFTKKF